MCDGRYPSSSKVSSSAPESSNEDCTEAAALSSLSDSQSSVLHFLICTFFQCVWQWPATMSGLIKVALKD